MPFLSPMKQFAAEWVKQVAEMQKAQQPQYTPGSFTPPKLNQLPQQTQQLDPGTLPTWNAGSGGFGQETPKPPDAQPLWSTVLGMQPNQDNWNQIGQANAAATNAEIARRAQAAKDAADAAAAQQAAEAAAAEQAAQQPVYWNDGMNNAG